MRVLMLVTVTVAALALAGCEVLEPKKIDYKSASKAPSLEVPPDLTAPTGDNRYSVPDVGGAGAATYSAYSRERAERPAAGAVVLPEQDKVRIERAGTQRWLVVSVPPEEAWPVIKNFWQELGFIINLESKETGVMETDWAENRANIPQDFIRRSIGKVIEGLYSTPERDKFRTRLEKGEHGTEIYISHRGMYEVYADEGKDKTVWQPRPPDPELEAEMLRRLMLRFGVEEARAETMLAKQQAPEMARIVGGDLEMDESFDRAWRRVGLALDRVGFAVEDRDRSRGTYYVRYIDPQIDNASKEDEGILSKLAFWRSGKEQTSPQLQIHVIELGDKTRVTVTGDEGKPADPNTQKRIINLLHRELK
ncbi:MAG: outer membrane protein assembly factor BamC [Pseudomonadota bacterium]